MLKGNIHSTETFGSVDGPGVRFIIFFQGCRMRCRYCHNADTWNLHGDNQMTADELLDRAERYRAYWGSEGGITVSGGEPLLQIDFLTDLLQKAKERGIHTCVDTAGQPFTREEPFFPKFHELLQFTDLLLADIKHIDNDEHLALTGHKNGNILDMLTYLSEQKKPVWIRHVLVPGITDNDDALRRTRAFMDKLGNVQRVEVLPYHAMGAFKWQALNIPYTLEDTLSPTEERVKNARMILGAV